jgi:hypothetical protein
MTRAKKSFRLELTKEQQALVLQEIGTEAKELADRRRIGAEDRHPNRWAISREIPRGARIAAPHVLSGFEETDSARLAGRAQRLDREVRPAHLLVADEEG